MANIAAQIPIFGGLFDDSDEQAMRQLQANQQIFGGIQLPQFKDYKPEDQQYVGDYNPEMAQAKQIAMDPAMRSQQLSALNKLAGYADTGIPELDQQGYITAMQNAGQEARGAREADLANAQSRGMGGSGLEFAMREAANQDAAQRALQGGLATASNSAQQRALYQQAYGNALSGMRGQDFNENAANSDIINRFNAMNTQNANQAQQYNLGQRQGLMSQNTQQHNYAQQYNNDLQQRQFQDAYQKASGQAGANNNVAQGYWGENAADTAARNQNTNTALSALGAAGVFKTSPTPAPMKTKDQDTYGGQGYYDSSTTA